MQLNLEKGGRSGGDETGLDFAQAVMVQECKLYQGLPFAQCANASFVQVCIHVIDPRQCCVPH